MKIRPVERPRSLQRRHLEAIVAIDDERSVHRAARGLGMAQPAASRLLAEAEALLGDRLFDRSSRGSRPTARGEGVIAQARAVLRGLERLQSPAVEASGPIRIGCIARAMYTLMPTLLQRLASDGDPPESQRLEVMEESSSFLWDAVNRGTLDFAILRGREAGDMPEGLVAERLYDERTVIVSGAGVGADTPLAPSDLRRRRWILPDARTSSREAFDRYCAARRMEPIRAVIETRSFETGLALVARTDYLSIAPESIARHQAEMGMVRIVRTRAPLPTSPTLLAFKRWAVDDPSLAAFRRAIHESAAAARTAMRR